MYAVIKDGGRQYRVAEGDVVDVDYREASAGDELTFGDVLACGEGEDLKIGSPLVAGASVTAEVVGVQQGDKLVVRKFRRRKNSRTKTGHRQMYTRVKISKIAV